ncbi:MAG: lactate dehydrogenase [Megasphaera sp.]|jgi:malate/lactate dehydrogenase|nr:lactate dehydrogenase [Megasphaera sp.]MCH4217449.1 lactate dehydrogenase [Megasphaera sp.]
METYYVSNLPGEIGATAMALKHHGLSCPVRVHILALGDVGMTMLIGLRLLGGDVIRSIGICDINEKNVQRLEMEINQIRYPFAGVYAPLPPVESIGEEQLFDCDVFIFCASKGVPPVGVVGDVRMAQLEANRGLIGHFAGLARKAAYSGLVCIVSDPVDPLCAAFLDASGCSPAQIQGYGLGVMNARACYYAERHENMRHYLTEGRAFGPHGQDLVIADSVTKYDDSISRLLTEYVVQANVAIRNTGYKPYIAPALSSAALSILLTLRGQWHYGSVYLGAPGCGAYFGVKNHMGPDGIIYEDIPMCRSLYSRLVTAYTNLCSLR